MIRHLFLMSSLRSGSHMVRSMLRDDEGIVDPYQEHVRPLAEHRFSGKTILYPVKYGRAGMVSDCLAAEEIADACALILHRRDARAQALSLAHAQKNGTWLGPTDRNEPVAVSEADVEKVATRNARDLARLQALIMPHVVLAYEDITVATLKAALGGLLGRAVTVVEPSTVKVASHFRPLS